MDNRSIDLHIHSTESDGTLTPTELAREAKQAGLAAFALTDHDTTAGIAEAADAAAKYDIEFVPGVELSTEYKGKEIHMVGLFLDAKNERLEKKLADFRENRKNRNQKMYELLQKEGFDITQEALRRMFPDAVLTRAHVARYLLEKGYIQSISEAFEKYIGDSCRCYVPRSKITPQEGISLIRQAGGTAILAHPILYHLSDERLRELIADCKEAGLTGIEALYSTYQPGDEQYIRRLAGEYGLRLSGGSDFHGSNKPHIRLGIGTGQLHVPYELLPKLKPESV